MSTDTWQAQAETNRVPEYGLAIGAENAKPVVTALGKGDQMTWASGFTSIAVYFTDDDIDIQPVEEEGEEINPPTAPGIIALIRDKVGIRRVVFTSYEIGAKLLQYSSNAIEVDASTGAATSGSGYWIESKEFTRVSLSIEIKGLGIMWFPSVEIKMAPPKANVKKPATQEVNVDVFCVTVGVRDITHVFLEYTAT